MIDFNEPVLGLPYRRRRNTFRDGHNREFFLSFSDSVRALLLGLGGKGSVILVPDFYCPETLGVFKQFGKLAFYKTKHDLSIDIDSYIEKVRGENPMVIVNYCFFGFPLDDRRILSALKESPDSIIIQDCAHRIVTEKELWFVSRKHFYIDSIRKQFSILGSNLFFQNRPDLVYSKGFSWYKLLNISTKIVQEAAAQFFKISKFSFLQRLNEACHDTIEATLGSNSLPARGDRFSLFLWNHIDTTIVLKHRVELIDLYTRELAGIGHEYFSIPDIPNNNLTYFPCIVLPRIRGPLINYLASRGYITDSLWDLPSQPIIGLNNKLFKSVMVLPLTWHMNTETAKRLCGEIKSCLQRVV